MLHSKGIATALGLALVAMTFTDARAAERPGQAMAEVSARLATATTHATALEAALSRLTPVSAPAAPGTEESQAAREHGIGAAPGGGGFPAQGSIASRPPIPVTDEIQDALNGLETAVREAQAIAGPQAYLDPGFAHVLTNAARIRGNAEMAPDALSLSREIDIELVALANNARVLEAEAELRAGHDAIGTRRAGAVLGHIDAAMEALADAQSRGAYHLEDDIAALKVAAARIQKGESPGAAVTRDDMAQLIADVHEHLADLGGD
jgi:hypothetical protein